MSNSNTEYSKKLRGKTANEAKKEAIKNGGVSMSVIIKDKELAEFVRKKIPNKKDFVIEAIKNYMNQLKAS